MSRINTNIASMNAIHKLVANNADMTTRLQRLSSGLRINTAKDDPAGLIASENLRSEIAGIKAGISNSTRASNVIATAEGALSEINSLLVDIKGLLVNSANKGAMSSDEIDANQLQVDSAINTIQRISNATEFEGIKLLNGNLAYTTSGLDAAQIGQLSVNSAKLIDGAAMQVSVTQTQSAQTGHLYFSGDVLSTAMTIQIGSGRGTTELTFASGTKNSGVRDAINAVKEITGVSAALSTAGDIVKMSSVDFGSDAYVSVNIISGHQVDQFELQQTIHTDVAATATVHGVDVAATINGAAAIGKGKKLTIRTSMLDAEIDLTPLQAQTRSATSFYITAGGADFAIGSKVDAIGLESVGIMNVSPSYLGNSTDGYLNTLKSGAANNLSGDNMYTAQRIVDDAIKNISNLRGRLGAFQKNVLDTNVNSLGVALENVTASESAIRDADFASETAALTRSQILVQANTSILSLANAMPQSVLALLG
jgi:flagellin